MPLKAVNICILASKLILEVTALSYRLTYVFSRATSYARVYTLKVAGINADPRGAAVKEVVDIFLAIQVAHVHRTVAVAKFAGRHGLESAIGEA